MEVLISGKTKLILGGEVASAAGSMRADLLIEGEKIKAQGMPGAFAGLEVDETIDASGKLLLPGLIDPHLHFNSPFMGTVSVHDFSNGTAAAAFGGITTLIDFSTQPKGGSIMGNLSQKEGEAEGKTYIDWSMSGILLDASPETLAEIPQLIRAGCPTYKCFTTYKHSGRLMDDAGIFRILRTTAEYGGMLMIHCEHDATIDRCLEKELSAGHFASIYHARSRPAAAENMAIQRLVEMLKQEPAPSYVVHTSTAESVEIIQMARAQGLPIHSETCTHYLALTEEKLEGPNSQFYICSPPLRTQRDVDALWQGLATGCLEVVSSDDAGVPTKDNLRLGQGRFDKVPSGMSGIEARLSILYTEGVHKGRISLPRLVEVSSTNIARLFGLYPEKGHLGPGADADVVIYDPSGSWAMTSKSLHMNTDFCPFEGWTIQGHVESVLCRGAYVIRDGRLVGKPGHGQRAFRRLTF
ncbi:MAG: dihydropyrimidinase [Proteobacteria bacterium]|nr:dihydropyrimidinase [Pseudomonadota bacterium]